MLGSSPSQRQRPMSYLVRPRSSSGKSAYSSKPMSTSFNTDKKRKLKKNSGFKMQDARRKPDYADSAYREAVGRLRILLAESYTPMPIKRGIRDLDSAGEETDNQSIVSVNSRISRFPGPRPYHHYLTALPRRYIYSAPKEKTLTASQEPAANPELMSFIERQEDYIEQLEKESRFCRDELSTLLTKVKDVISENENLHQRQKSNIMKSVFSHLETEETETEETDADFTSQNRNFSLSPKKLKRVNKTLEGPAIVFESRISELEAHLTQTKIDLKKALEENEAHRKKVPGTGADFDIYRKQVESLQREKDVAQDTVAKLQFALSKIKDKENDTCDKVKRSLDVAEQAQYEKNAAELEIRRLKDEIERQHSKLRDAISDQSRRISEERGAVERRYTQQIEQLTTELGVQWETTNKFQLELDKERRENTDLRRVLAQKQALLEEARKDLHSKITSLQSDIGVNAAEKSTLEQQMASLQMLNERNDRQAKQETSRLQAEMQSLRQRLDRADADLIHSRRENIRLTEQIASLEKEIKLNSALNDEKRKSSHGGEILALPPPAAAVSEEKNISTLIKDMENKHVATVAELEGMIHSQNQLMDKLSGECHTLTQKLEDASTRHKEEIRELQNSLNRLNFKVSQSELSSTIKKDEDYNSTRTEELAPLQDSSKPLSRTNSNATFPPNKDHTPSQIEAADPALQTEFPTELQDYPNPEYDQSQYNPEQYGYMPEEYMNDPAYVNQGYGADPNDPNYQYSEYADLGQNYIDPNQQYLTEEEYQAQQEEIQAQQPVQPLSSDVVPDNAKETDVKTS